MQNLRFALRQLAKSPAYTALAVIALALGIGANTAIFSAINTLFLRPLAYADADQLVRVWGSFPEAGLEQANLSWPRYQALRDQQEAMTDLAAYTFTGFTLTGRGDPEQVQGVRVTDRFFPLLRVQPLLGRLFTPAEDRAGAPPVVILSHAYWQRRFGGDAGVIGQTLNLDGRPYTVIGVLPPSVGFPFAQVQAWTTRVFETEGLSPDLIERGTGYLFLVGRLKPGSSIAQTDQQLHLISQRYGAAQPDKVDSKAGLSVLSLQEDLVGGQRRMFFVLLGAVGFVLLIACANVANLLLARFAARRKEIAVRSALGATRRQIVGQFLVESLLTALLAGALGLVLASWGISVLATAAANFIPRATELSLDPRVLGFAVVLSLVTGVLLGLVPALQASRADASEALKDSSRGSTGGRRAGRVRSALLVAEVALSLVLLVGAGLLVSSFLRLQRVDPGFRADDVTTFNLALPAGHYPDTAHRTLFYEQLLEQLKRVPGVTHASGADALPVVGGFARSPYVVEGRTVPPVNSRPTAVRSTTVPGFFDALRIPLRRGRDFTWRDRESAPNVVIINEVMARRLFPNEDPVGRRLITGIQSIPREIIGVVGDVRSQNLARAPQEEMYYPSAQISEPFYTFVVRSARPAASLRNELVAAVRNVDAGLPVAEVQPLTELLTQAVADRRLVMGLIGAFAGLALVLAGMGIYSVIAYSVAQRTNEIGIRLALGAAPGQVVQMVLLEGMKLAALGLAIGLLVSLLLTHLMANLLFDVSATDPMVFGGVAAFLTAITALACWLPARHATRVDPMVALRNE